MKNRRSRPSVLDLPPVSEEAIDCAIEQFEPLAGRKLSREDGREIAQNLLGFFQLLAEWDAQDRAQDAAKVGR